MLTEQQQKVLEAFRACYISSPSDVCGMPLNDQTFLRYLRARKFDIEHAKTLLNSTIEWRKKYGLDEINTTWRPTIEHENSTGKLFVRGYDKEGHAILYMRPRNENSRSHEGNVKHLIFNMEKSIACMKARSNKEKVVLLIDYKGYSITNSPPMKTSMEILHILQDHYPERLKRAYMINPPWIFSTFWTMISHFVDPVTKEKIIFVRDAQLKEKLSETIDINILETSLLGLDDRPFDSKAYLDAPFNMDYYTLLEQNGVKKSSTLFNELESESTMSKSTSISASVSEKSPDI